MERFRSETSQFGPRKA